MPRFTIQITRIGYATRGIEVEAADEPEAQRLALQTAGNYEFREHDVEYERAADRAQNPPKNLNQKKEGG